jgi:hypothetical protein
MPRNGSNVYSPPAGTTATTGTTIESAKYNAFVADVAADLNLVRPIAAGGTGASTAAGALVALGLTATAAEINTLDGITASTAELNILDGVTATAAELNILDGVTATAAELNILDGVTATAAELNVLDGVASLQTTITDVDTAIPTSGAVVDHVKAVAGWSPYNGTDAVLYDVSVGGATAAVEATFADGYEYLVIADHISGTAVSSPALRIYRNSTAAYSSKSNQRSGTASAASFYYVEIEFRQPRVSKRAHVGRSWSYAQIDAGIAEGFDALASSTTVVGMTHASATVINKVEISMSTGNIDAGRILLYRRPAS